jgi:site-specific recombinase XerD
MDKRQLSKKGSRLTVEPIRNLKDIKAIKKLLSDKPRDCLLFLMGINNGLRTIDMLKVKVSDVKNLKVGDTLTIREGKTDKDNVLMINKSVHKALKKYLDTAKPKDTDYLFASRKGNKHLQSQAVGDMVKKWTSEINLKGQYGAHTLRKTFGYIQRTKYGVGFEILCKRYNHASPTVTMRYLGIQDKEVNQILMNDIG